MEIALEQMRLSRSEHTPDTPKRDPLVGAVLVDSRGKLLGKAHRSSFSAGDHAEFSLLAKERSDVDASGGTLYVTLEPCISRQPPKFSCAERIVQANVARVVVGMVDPNPDIKGRGIAYLLHHGVDVDWFDSDLQEAIQRENREFIEHFEDFVRKPEVLEESPLLLKTVVRPKELEYPSDEEIRLVAQAGLGDLSDSALSRFVTERGWAYAVPSNELWEHLRKALFLKSRAEGEQLAPTVAGLVLFGRNPDTFIPQCKVKADCYYGTPAEGAAVETTKKEEVISGWLDEVVTKVNSFFLTHVQRVPRIEGSERVVKEEYPWPALREALVNALVHRDYRMGGNVYFQMFRDRIVVKSPGPPLRPNSLERFRDFTVVAHPRNPRIADTAASLKLMELKGEGIRTMRKRLRDYGLPNPRFDFDGVYFTVTVFGREKAAVRMRLTSEILEKLSSRQLEMLEIIKTQGRITSKDCEKSFRVTRQAANKDFTYLMRLGLIERKGSGRATYYVLGEF